MTDEQDVIPTEAEESLKPDQCENCESLKTEKEEHKINWQRALADYRNLQKETAAMRSQWAQMSEEHILQNFIPVYENFKKAFYIDSADADATDNTDMKR